MLDKPQYRAQYRVDFTMEESASERHAFFADERSAYDFLSICRALPSCREVTLFLVGSPELVH